MLLNKAPRTGTDPSQGICDRSLRSLACSRPAIAKLWPSRSSIVVTASRLISDGTVVPEIVTALAKSSSLTSGAIRRLIRPFCRTVGVNDSRTPKGLYSIVGVTSPLAEVAAIGTGNSPPARNCAVSPESAIRLGSARRRISPLVSSAVTRTSIFVPPLTRLASTTPKGDVLPTRVPVVWSSGMPLGVLLGAASLGDGTRPPCPALTTWVPERLAANQFTPSARPQPRDPPRKPPLTNPCCEGATLIALTTPFGAN